jgi:hypothetical protein
VTVSHRSGTDDSESAESGTDSDTPGHSGVDQTDSSGTATVCPVCGDPLYEHAKLVLISRGSRGRPTLVDVCDRNTTGVGGPSVPGVPR